MTLKNKKPKGNFVNIKITDELKEQMQDFPEVNWSEICRDGIVAYITSRQHKLGE